MPNSDRRRAANARAADFARERQYQAALARVPADLQPFLGAELAELMDLRGRVTRGRDLAVKNGCPDIVAALDGRAE